MSDKVVNVVHGESEAFELNLEKMVKILELFDLSETILDI